MVDKLTKEKRSWNMGQIPSKDTKPEKTVRSLLHRLGYRFRLHKKDLPGKPDVVLNKFKKVVFIHGCFWHGHKNCINASKPKTNSGYWEEKITNNIKRDKTNKKKLIKLGWEVITIWECELEGPNNNLTTFIVNRIFP